MPRKLVFWVLCLFLAGCNFSMSATGDSAAPPTSAASVYHLRPAVNFAVEANKGWQSAYVEVHEGDRVTVTYTGGQWTQQRGYVAMHDAADQNGYTCGHSDCAEQYPDVPKGALVARIGTQIVPIGNGATFRAAMTRTLALRMNDGDAGLSDNDGAIQVSIVVETTAQ